MKKTLNNFQKTIWLWLLAFMPILAQAQPKFRADLTQGERAAIFLKPIVKQNNRDKIVIDYNSEYATPKMSVAQINWNGNVAACNAGSISQKATQSAMKRLNYYRTLMGLKPLEKFIDSLNLKCQQAALVCKANKQLSHFPPTTWSCYSTVAAKAAASSNLSMNYNTDHRYFIDQYIEDAGTYNTAVGHRRWLLNTQAQHYGFGAVIDSNSLNSNALWVFPSSWNIVNDTIPEYIAYPMGGYFPKKLLKSLYNQGTYRWSFSVSGANFDSTQVEMYDELGAKLNFVTHKRENGYAENTIVWEPTINTNGINDVIYKVKVKKVKINGINKEFEYDVVLIDNKIYKPEFTIIAPSCANYNGSISLKYTPGYQSLKWSNGSKTEDLTNLSEGKYYVTIIDKYGFELKDSVVLKAKIAPLSINLTAIDATCGKNNASISALANGAVQSYRWSNNANTQTINNLAIGKYTLTITSIDNCISTKEVEIKAKPVGVASVVTQNTSCGKTNGTAEAILTGMVATKKIVWSNGEKLQKLTNLSGGAYSVTITDENGCESIANNNVVALLNPSISLVKTDATCGKSNGTITATSPDDVKYAWESGEKTSALNNLMVGTYTVTATNNDGCTISKFTTINALPVISFTLSAKNTTCNENDGRIETTITNAVNAKSFLWSNSTTNAAISGLSGGIYTLTVTDTNNCIVVEKATIKALKSPIVNLGADLNLKNGETITLDAGPGFSYQWSNGAKSQTIKINAAGTYSVTITNVDACTATDEIKVKTLVATNDIENNDYHLSPNPAQDYITLLSGQYATNRVYIVNLLGQMLLEDTRFFEINQPRNIDVSSLKKGVYFLVIEQNNTKKAIKFTKI